jgi:Guanosine polyphosphate pyrophosphohydrolases/synthetases
MRANVSASHRPRSQCTQLRPPRPTERIDQRRKYTQQPYREHLEAVAGLVAQVTDDPEMLAAAWLHDTVEDTPATFGEIERAFGPAVRALVADLTDVSVPGDGNRAVRKAIDRQHTARASTRAKTIKLADLIDNCRDICAHDPRFARVYLSEAAALLEVLDAGDPGLYRQAQQAVADCARRLDPPDLP